MPHHHTPSQPVRVQRLLKRLLIAPVFSAALCALLLPSAASATAADRSSSKRGLIDIETLADAEQDDTLLTDSSSDITWYYNYESQQSTYLSGVEFVPMLWGGYNYDNFASNVTSQIEAGVNITTVIGFNEPDGCDGGGSCMTAADAAAIWIAQIEPLKASHGLKLGSPATTGSAQGIQWLREWFQACNGSCNPDFMTTHYYGDFDSLSSWVGELYGYYGANATDGLWVTEFAYPYADLDDTQSYYNDTINFLDGWSYVTRYSYFGAFRSDVSNIGVDAAFLTGDGKLTDLGSWYMGGNATGNSPSYTSGASMIKPGVGFACSVFIGLMIACSSALLF